MDDIIVKNLAQNETFRVMQDAFTFSQMKPKRTLPPTTVGRRPRRSYETSQKRDREAIDAAFKRLIGDDGFKSEGAFGTRRHDKGVPWDKQPANGL
jgi:hypothetical protein